VVWCVVHHIALHRTMLCCFIALHCVVCCVVSCIALRVVCVVCVVLCCTHGAVLLTEIQRYRDTEITLSAVRQQNTYQ
jgi:hypothetical protein